MVHMRNKGALIKKVVFVVVLVYVIITFIKQQKILNSYKVQSIDLQAQIEEEKKYQDELMAKKANVNSSEYIEAIAREKLDMYLPNERVYIDSEK